MKHFINRKLSALLMLFSLACPALAHAEWVMKEVKWRISGRGPTGLSTTVWVRDTTVTSIGPVDTTASFNLDDAVPLPRGIIGPGLTGITNQQSSSGNDTTAVAWLILVPDTTVAVPAPAFTGVTALIDGRGGPFGSVADVLSNGWVKADSALANGAVGGGMILGDQTISLPIRSMSPYGVVMKYPELRARITGVGGATGLAAAHVFLRYWTPDYEGRRR